MASLCDRDTPLTVACVWVNGHVKYPVIYVERLASMVKRWLKRPHQFVCFTDRPWMLPLGVRGIPIQHPPDVFGWWAKVQLFNPKHELTGRVLYLDLDTLIVSELDPIVDFPASFALVPNGGTFKPRNGMQVVKKFNSSVMVWTVNGEDGELYRTWSPKVAERLFGDQDWIGEQRPGAAMMPIEWFPRLSELGGKPPIETAKVVLAKKPKNLDAAKEYQWFREAWQ